MIPTVRTTIRIRKDLMELARKAARENSTNLQKVVNDTLARGFTYAPDLNKRKKLMSELDVLRAKIKRKYGNINTEELINKNKKEQQIRSDILTYK